jgi:hypothetical protein
VGQEFLGVGWKYPLQLDQQSEIALSRAEDSIREAIWMILSIAPGERLMHPDFGCRIHELVFAPNDASTIGLARHYVEDALRTWEPRIELEDVIVQVDPANPTMLLISVDYLIRTTDSRFNVVYPFYLTRGVTG